MRTKLSLHMGVNEMVQYPQIPGFSITIIHALRWENKLETPMPTVTNYGFNYGYRGYKMDGWVYPPVYGIKGTNRS